MNNFKRDISYNLLKRDDGMIAMSAKMYDQFHDIRVEVLVDIDSLVVTTASVDFVRFPSSDCPNVSHRIEGLIGFTIGKGLNRKLADIFGGAEGCGNLRLLLSGLLPLAINAKAAAGFDNEQEMMDSIRNQLQGSCAGYALQIN